MELVNALICGWLGANWTRAWKVLEEYNKWGLKINLEEAFYMECVAEMKDLLNLERLRLEDVNNLSIWV